MKLDTERIFAPLLRLQQRINAPQVEYDLVPMPKPVITLDIDSAKKVQAAQNILHNPSGLFTIDKYSGLFLLYIPSVNGFKMYGTLPKFHFMLCSTIKAMEKNGRLERFRLTSDTSGLFVMSDGSSRELDVCQNCLKAWK